MHQLVKKQQQHHQKTVAINLLKANFAKIYYIIFDM